MTNINETIANVEKLDPELAHQLRKYVRDHSYGLIRR
jgi:adenine-specific DNA-methyltransferase